MLINGRNSYLTENSVLTLEDRSFNAVYGNNRCLSQDKNMEQANAVLCVKPDGSYNYQQSLSGYRNGSRGT